MINYIVNNLKSQELKTSLNFIERIYFSLDIPMRYITIILTYVLAIRIVVGVFFILSKVVSHNLKIGKNIQLTVPEEEHHKTVKHKK